MLDSFRSLLGFANRAGKIAAGDSLTRAKLRKNLVFLVISAEDASPEIKKYYKHKCEQRGVPYFSAGQKIDLGLTVGKSHRSVLGILDPQFAEAIVEKMREKGNLDQYHGGEKK